MKAYRPRSPGFTLMEMLLVMLLIAIIAGIVAPQFGQFSQGRRVNDSARLILGLAQFARGQAASEGRVYRLNIDTANRKVWLTADAGGGLFQNITNIDYSQQFTLADNVSFDDLKIDPQPNTQMNRPDSMQQDSVQQATPINGQTMGQVGSVLINSHLDGGAYVEFEPTGRTDPVSIILKDNSNKRVQLICETPTELLHIANKGEAMR